MLRIAGALAWSSHTGPVRVLDFSAFTHDAFALLHAEHDATTKVFIQLLGLHSYS